MEKGEGDAAIVLPQNHADFVNVKTPEVEYTITKTRVSQAKPKPEDPAQYGFRKGNMVDYAVTIENKATAEGLDLVMDVTDEFVDDTYFTELAVKSVTGNGVTSTPLTGAVGERVRIPAGETAVVTFTAKVNTDTENPSDAAADDGKGYENVAKTGAVKYRKP